MSLQPLAVERVEEVLAAAVRQELVARLAVAQPGHCLRVSNLAPTIMHRLARELSSADEFDVVLLLAPHQFPKASWEVTATRLVELRNLEARPLLAFVPPTIKTAAEDSFDKSTFQDIPLTDVPRRIWQRLVAALPGDVQRSTRVAIDYLQNIQNVSDADLMHYFLAITDNGATLESAGAAIYLLHAIPDFKLFDQPDRIRQRLDRNLSVVKSLAEGAGSLLGRIHQLKLKPDSIQLALYQHLSRYTGQGVVIWGQPLACDLDGRSLAFDCWQFEGEDPNRSVLIIVDDMSDLPTRDASVAPGADNPRYLDLNKAKNVKVKWSTDPKPSVAPGLAYFRIEIISTEEAGSGAVAWESKNIPIGSAARAERTKSLKVAEFSQQLDEGLYYFRVRGYSASGDILNDEAPIDPRTLRDPENPDGKRTNESEDIWFWKSEDEPPPVEPTRNQSVESYAEARTLAYLASIDRGQNPFDAPPQLQQDKTGWAVPKSSRRSEDVYNVVFDAQTRFTLSVSAQLRKIEQATLTDARNLGRWRWTVSDLPSAPQSDPLVRVYGNPERVPPAFLEARQALFSSIRGGDATNRLTVTTDLLPYGEQITRYATAYLAWLQTAEEQFEPQIVIGSSEHRRTDPLVLDIDVTEIRLGEEDQYQSIYLLAPTHPLRLLWLLQRARMVDVWLYRAVESGKPKDLLTDTIRQFMRREVTAHNLPPVLRSSRDERTDHHMRFFMEHGVLTGGWSLYLREDTADTQMLRARIERLLGQSRTASGADLHVAKGLARNLRRYLVQHPYVKTLKINMFNPGDAGTLVNAIVDVEKELFQQYGRTGGLRYVINLFGESDRLEAIGSALDELQNPERQVSEEVDAFTQVGANPLFPKLVFSRNHIDEFLRRQEQFQAHVSLLLDILPHQVGLHPAFQGRSSFLYGLLQEQLSLYNGSGDTIVWQRQLAPGYCPPLTADDPIPAMLSKLLTKIGRLQASNAVGRLVERLPTVEMRLDVSARGLLHAIHSRSDWVLTVDKYLGLEYFDSDAREDRGPYLLDVRPEYGGVTAPRIMVTTRAVDEIQRLVRPRLLQYGLMPETGAEVEFLHVLRSLSGRIAVKLLSSPTQVAEAIGLALARLFLEQYDLLHNAVVIPVDAHADLFRNVAASDLEQEVTLKRSDLLLVTVDTSARSLQFHIVEVKFYTDLSSFGALNALHVSVEEQVANTIAVLRTHFDASTHTVDRLDRELKTRELIALLSFYLARAQRFGLVDADAAAEMQRFLECLDQGYELRFTASGLIFDLASRGVDTTEAHADLVFHRIGRDFIERLIHNALRRRELRQEEEKAASTLLGQSDTAIESRARQEITTTFRTDGSYERVRTYFPSGRKEWKGAATAESSQTSDLSPNELGGSAQVAAQQKAAPDAEGDEVEDTAIPETPAADAPSSATTAHETITPVEDAQDGQEPLLPPALSVTGSTDATAPMYDILIGNDVAEARQYGILGISNGRRVALDTNTTNTISLFGVQGGGKSYTVGTIVEMATQPLPGLNLLPKPLASVIFHYHESQDYAPEFVSMIDANNNASEVDLLRREYGADVARLEDVLLLTSADKLAHRRAEFPSLRVEPIYFSSSELSTKDWRFLMGVAGNQMYMKQANLIMRQLRDQITLPRLREEILASDLNDSQKKILGLRLDIASQFINDSYLLSEQLKPGRLIIVDLRDEYIDKDEALGLFVVMLNIFANAGREGGAVGEVSGFNKLIVFDEAHKYMDNPDLTGHIVDVIRQMRHQGVSVLIASQDPPSLPNAIIELSSVIVLHRFNSPQWLKHIQKSVTSLSELTSAQLSSLRAGDAYIWATKSTERVLTQKAVKMRLRPRATRHGGATRTAV